MRKKLAERAAGYTTRRLVRVALKRLGVPFWLWPVLWAGHKIVRHQVRKRGLDMSFERFEAALRAPISDKSRERLEAHVRAGEGVIRDVPGREAP